MASLPYSINGNGPLDTGTSSSVIAANSITYNVDFASDRLYYVAGAAPRSMRDLGREESAEEWLERRVNEVRVKL